MPEARRLIERGDEGAAERRILDSLKAAFERVAASLKDALEGAEAGGD